MNRHYNGEWNSQFLTSNSEYGCMQMFPKPVSMNPSNYGGFSYDQQNNATARNGPGQSNAGYENGSGFGPMYSNPAFHAHQPTCPNYNAGQNAFGTQQLNGIYDTGGNGSTDFQVLVGDAAAAELAKSGNRRSGENYGTQFQAEPQSGSLECQGSGDSQGNEAGTSGIGFSDRIRQDTKSSGDPRAFRHSPQDFVKMTGLRLQKEYKAKPVMVSSMLHQYSCARGGDQKLQKPQNQFYLCGKCQKCQLIKEPNSEPNEKALAHRFGRLPTARKAQPKKK